MNKNKKLLIDIIRPGSGDSNKSFLPSQNTQNKRFELPGIARSRQRTKFSRIAIMAVIVCITLFGAIVWEERNQTTGAILTAYREFVSRNLSVNINRDNVTPSNTEQTANILNIESFTNVLGLISSFREAPRLAFTIQELNSASISTEESIRYLQNNWLRWVWSDGDKLISHLEETQNQVLRTARALVEARNNMTALGARDVPTNFLALHSEIQSRQSLLNGISDLLKNNNNVAIFFMNDATMRATGGLIGHYAVAQISEGEVRDLSINDIRYPDQFIQTNIIPPSPLIGNTTRFGLANANWFFDFSKSASKLLTLLESSSVYNDRDIKFSGAIAVNYRVITDILKKTGPIELPEYGVVIDHHNFILHTHREIAGSNVFRNKEQQNIFRSMMPEIISRIQKMSVSDKNELMRNLTWRLNNKDIQLYFKNEGLQGFVSQSLWGGEVYQAQNPEESDYLAVVVSNIGGAKTDAYVRQKISLQSVINFDGLISNELSITRVHEGTRATEAFYRASNQTHIRALTPKGSTLTRVRGATTRATGQGIRRGQRGADRDEDVELFEQGIESGKTVFGEWLTVTSGSNRTFVMQYERQGRITDRFRFVFERQSGVDTMLSYTIQAPPGFIFKETGGPIYEYTSAVLPARLIIDLTLQRIPELPL